MTNGHMEVFTISPLFFFFFFVFFLSVGIIIIILGPVVQS